MAQNGRSERNAQWLQLGCISLSMQGFYLLCATHAVIAVTRQRESCHSTRRYADEIWSRHAGKHN
jgi:hypothetical protein